MKDERAILGPIEPFLRGLALVVWAFVGLSRLEGDGPKLWLAPWLVYAAGMLLGAARSRLPHPVNVGVLLAQSASVLALPVTGFVGFEGMLLSFVVVQLPAVISLRAAVVWAALHVPLLLPFVWSHNSARQLIEICGAYAGFSTFALLVHYVRLREQVARAALAKSNASLLATRAMLVEGSRQAERLRISRELHDSLGHHLTALNLHLDLAARQTSGPAAEALQRAKTISQQSLAEVRKVVSEMQAEGGVDLLPSLRALAAGVPAPKVHIEAPDTLSLADAATSHTVFRCVQEAITNALKHSAARNVWVKLALVGPRLEVTVRDDGAGAAKLVKGRGLDGISARVAELGGEAHFESGAGFTVVLKVPA
ncbi:MAG: sensor histidine kinase [Myxococcaceae bacterium]|nr:sensor histidine kinase [Myxococcaceae bacterium]